VIILVHGLANKPEKKLLAKWSKKSIREGFKTISIKKLFFGFELVYWADLMHERPQTSKIKDEKSDEFLNDPYVPGNPIDYENYEPSQLKQKILTKLEQKLDKIFFDGEKSFLNYEKFSSIIIRKLFKELDYYYHKDCPVKRFIGIKAKQAIRERLSLILDKYRKKQILLIGHSMGSIISYDVLTQTSKDIQIDTFVTIGSPLGLPVIVKKILEEQGLPSDKSIKPSSPENIQAWYNFSDLGDPVSINYELSDDYEKNSRGIGPADSIIYNNYKYEGKRDAHKLYGYLRAPDVSKLLYDFLTKK
jgi:hypothetical protein